MTTIKTTAIAYVALLCTVLVLLGLSAVCSLETAAVKAEIKGIREEAEELAKANTELMDTNAELRDSLVTLSDEYHRLWDETHTEETAWHDAGEFTITHYCGCSECCGKSDCITATGTLAKMGRAVSVDPDVIPLGSEVLINGQVFHAEDTGVSGNHIDLYIDSHDQALAMGVYKTEVSWR